MKLKLKRQFKAKKNCYVFEGKATFTKGKVRTTCNALMRVHSVERENDLEIIQAKGLGLQNKVQDRVADKKT